MGPESKNQAGLLIKCRGEYYYKTETAKGRKPFTQDVRAPSLNFFHETSTKYIGTDDKGIKQFKTASFLNIRGVLKKRLLPVLLQRRFSDFARVRYTVVEEIRSLDNSPLDLPLQFQSLAQLTRYVKDHDIPITPGDYIEIDELRTDILEYEQDPETFLATKKDRDTRRSEERAFLEMNDLNADTPVLAPRTPVMPPTDRKDKKAMASSRPSASPASPAYPASLGTKEKPTGIEDL